MRNTAFIYEYKQALDCDNIMDAKTSTVKGKQVIFIQEYKWRFLLWSTGALEGEKKFVCFLPDSDQIAYIRFQAELKLRNIPANEYLDKQDEKNFKAFISAPAGCLVTMYKHARDTEDLLLSYHLLGGKRINVGYSVEQLTWFLLM